MTGMLNGNDGKSFMAHIEMFPVQFGPFYLPLLKKKGKQWQNTLLR